MRPQGRSVESQSYAVVQSESVVNSRYWSCAVQSCLWMCARQRGEEWRSSEDGGSHECQGRVSSVEGSEDGTASLVLEPPSGCVKREQVDQCPVHTDTPHPLHLPAHHSQRLTPCSWPKFHSVQKLGKTHMRCTPSLRRLPSVAVVV